MPLWRRFRCRHEHAARSRCQHPQLLALPIRRLSPLTINVLPQSQTQCHRITPKGPRRAASPFTTKRPNRLPTISFLWLITPNFQKTKTHRQLFKIDNGFSHLLFLLRCLAPGGRRGRRGLVDSTPVTGAAATAVKPPLAAASSLPTAATLPTQTST